MTAPDLEELERLEKILPDPRNWITHGGGGQDEGEDGLRAMVCIGEGVVGFLEDYRTACAEAIAATMGELRKSSGGKALVDALTLYALLTRHRECPVCGCAQPISADRHGKSCNVAAAIREANAE